MMRKTIILLLLTMTLSFTLNASQRYALIIGNSDYERIPLRNPANDANDLANVLENLDFKVTKFTNANQEEMEQTIAEFGNRVGKDDVALFYYSGHGLQVKGSNYLIPLQAAIDDEHDIKYRAVPVSWILDELSVAQMNIFILDACRNNPFKGIKSLDRGLAQINSTPPETFIAFATAPGTVAVDGSGKNSPYTKNLIEQMQKPNIPIEKMFKNVRSNVIKETNNKQTPWENTCLTADFIFCMSGSSKPPTTPDIEVETEYTYGNIKVQSNTDGSVYLDNDYVCGIEAGTIKTIKNIQTGSHTVKVKTEDDTKKQDVYVSKNRATSASFKFISKIDISDDMVFVEGGTFRMGSTNGASDEKPVHSVTVDDFYISKHDVTQAEWEEVMGDNPSNFKGDNRPVEDVSWYDAVEFCNKNSEMEGLEKCYSGSEGNIQCDFSANGYRLPTEAEWEYAARGGNKSRGYKYSGSNDIDKVAWYSSNSDSKTHLVGKKTANELGIYDMSGNVNEWCSDWYGSNYYENSPRNNPTGPSSGSRRVLRGGSWGSFGYRCRVAGRSCGGPAGSFNGGRGFRFVKSVE